MNGSEQFCHPISSTRKSVILGLMSGCFASEAWLSRLEVKARGSVHHKIFIGLGLVDLQTYLRKYSKDLRLRSALHIYVAPQPYKTE